MSSVQQKPDSQLAAEAALDQHDLGSAVSTTHIQAPLDLEEGPQGNLEIEEVIRAERERARKSAPPERQIPLDLDLERGIDPSTLVDHAQEKMLADKFSALEREADKLRALALEQQVERIPAKKLHIASEQATPETEPVINRRRMQPSLNIQVKAEPVVKAAPAKSEQAPAVASERILMDRPRKIEAQQSVPLQKEPQRPIVQQRAEPKAQENRPAPRREEPPRVAQQTIIQPAQRTVINQRTVVPQPVVEKPTAPQSAVRQAPKPEPAASQAAAPQPEIVRNNRRPESERPIVREPAPQPLSAAARETTIAPAKAPARESELKMEVRQDDGLTLEQALKLDLSRAKIGTGAATKQITFRGHSLGSGTMLDRLITAVADFIKKLEMRAFSFLDRKRLERKTVKINTPEAEELEDDGLHLQSFSRSLSRERRKRRRLFSRFRK